MRSNFRIRSSRFLVTTPNYKSASLTRAIFGNSINESEKKESKNRPQILNDSFIRKERLEKSLGVIKRKKEEIEKFQNVFYREKVKRLRIKVDIKKVEIKFRKAAVTIQRVFRGFLARKMYRPALLRRIRVKLESKIKELDRKLGGVYENFGNFKDSAIVIQKHVRVYLQRKKILLENFCKAELLIKQNKAAEKIQKFFRIYLQKKWILTIKSKLESIKQRLKLLRAKEIWNKHKFAWKVIQKHYGFFNQDDYLNLELDGFKLAVPQTRPSIAPQSKLRKKPKKSKKTNKLKPPLPKSCRVTSNSALSGKIDTEVISETIPHSSLYKDERSESHPYETLSEYSNNGPLNKVKIMFKQLNLDEDTQLELMNEIEIRSVIPAPSPQQKSSPHPNFTTLTDSSSKIITKKPKSVFKKNNNLRPSLYQNVKKTQLAKPHK